MVRRFSHRIGGIMNYLVNSREMKQCDRNTIERLGMPSMVLMERAALAVVDEMKREGIHRGPVLVACGSGNNGGDGYAIARLLMLEGYSVDVVSPDIEDGRGTEENLLQRRIWQAYGQEILSQIPDRKDYTAVIDALFGIGLSRDVEGSYAVLIEALNTLQGTKIAVDIASGISADSGEVLGAAFRADLTVTFAFAKLGSVLWPGSEYAGRVAVRDIGIDAHSFLRSEPKVASLAGEDLAWLPARIPHSNKGTYGKLLVIAGSISACGSDMHGRACGSAMAGAAFLSAKAAYACGCGLVRIYTPEENRTVLQTLLPEAVITVYPAEKPDEKVLIDALDWADAVVCGPGIGTSESAGRLVRAVLQHASVPVLFDADALNLISHEVEMLFAPHPELIVTPHLGEMSRLSGRAISDLQRHLIAAAEEFAERYHTVCVLKDARTVTSVPGGQTYLNLSGNSGMATAGSGDVLSGVIGSLMAQGMQPKDAAPLGVYLHGLAGDSVRRRTGERGMMASDLIEGLIQVLKDWEQRAE